MTGLAPAFASAAAPGQTAERGIADTTALDARVRAAALTRRLNQQAERERDERASRLAVGIPDFDRWPLVGLVAEVAVATRKRNGTQR